MFKEILSIRFNANLDKFFLKYEHGTYLLTWFARCDTTTKS
ncbi:MAG: hypothetical protein JWP94_2727 [Mucilaginibacter sp.]|jgi:hypothetical protein|nr:hypothetical protein [Mucilaginibacter sp.]